ncbi:hypothetical protein CVIRNUC_010592 [Coccomyxa viridis]|uniref:RNA-binding S4 domain-containing protein n=1 Tax=Coccomyxa viridis TaxID=1274662 RepID=A0AAV1IL05_9CHLO|nr:hypothetical protein CVIRNUC_010592 [Coccomyxa viridis]
MSIRTACLRLPAAGFQQCSSRLPHWRSAQTMRMCSAMAQEQEALHTFSVPDGSQKRLDAFLSANMQDTSRARLQHLIRDGHVAVNGRPASKAGQGIRSGDTVTCEVPPPVPVEAAPEDIPLDVVYEDEHLLVLNKAAGMVVHPAPGNYSGTLVNALLHRFGMPAVRLQLGRSGPEESGLDEAESTDGDGDLDPQPTWLPSESEPGVIRPGIVHRLDKGTTGLLVAAKDARTLAALAEQFKAHTVERIYQSIALGCPRADSGVIETNIGRDIRDRKKMGTFPYRSSRGRHAVSTWQLLDPLAGGTASLLQWRLQTGRTHQIRVHAKHMGHPLLGDEAYGGAAGTAINAIGQGKSRRQAITHIILRELNRPSLHAKTLGFIHPVSMKRLNFTSELPQDLRSALIALREI